MREMRKITMLDDKEVFDIIRKGNITEISMRTSIPIPTLKNYLYKRVNIADMPVSKRLKFNVYDEELCQLN